jgi:hypothetical protein
VVGPPPENLTGQSLDDKIELRWDKDYACENVQNNYFLGFSVWRKENTNPFAIDSCQEGLDGKGYEIIAFNTTAKDSESYVYLDDFNLEKGKIYCYRVLANFALRTPSNNPYNITESLASDEICLQLKQDIPLITKVSVERTGQVDGAINLEWIKPLLADFDTTAYPGPYDYQVLRSADGTNYAEISGATINSPFFNSDILLQYTDTMINTVVNQYYYRIDFYSQNQFYSSSKDASSVFVTINSSDKQNILSWEEYVPWNNFEYTIFRQSTGTLDSITTISHSEYKDLNLNNDQSYCYLIKSVGTYGLSTTPSPLVNFSQYICGSPLDTVGPCAPVLMVNSPCDNSEDLEPSEFVNTINWNISLIQCQNFDDLAGYILYYAPSENSPLEIIFETNDVDDNEYLHQPQEGISGCYAISSVDGLGIKFVFKTVPSIVFLTPLHPMVTVPMTCLYLSKTNLFYL